jgi:hypothetical protein
MHSTSRRGCAEKGGWLNKMPTNAQALILEAKRLQRLQSQRRKQRKALKNTDQEIKLVRKHIRALAAANDDDQLPPQWKGKIE